MLAPQVNLGPQSSLDPTLRRQRVASDLSVRSQSPANRYGNRLLVDVVEGTARREPNRAFVHQPKTARASDGFVQVTYREAVNAINHLAHLITKELGVPAKNSFPTICYIGSQDIRYILFLIACVKAGYKALLNSPRNSLEAALSLLQVTDCHALFYAESQQKTVEPWLQNRPMKHFVIDSMAELLASEPEPFPYNKSFEEAVWEPVVVLHTSGSTGIPKPIIVRHGSLAVADAYRNLPEIGGGRFFFQEYKERTKLYFRHMPLFHAASVYGFLCGHIMYGIPMAFGCPDSPLTAEHVMECIKYSGSDSCMLPPSVLEEVANSAEGLALLDKMSFVTFGGGPVAPATGDKLAARGILLQSAIGSTEQYPYAMHFQTNPANWQYFIFNIDAMGGDFRPIDGPGSPEELVIVRKGQGKLPTQSVFYTFPDKTEWSTNDIFAPHPELPNHWTYKGRIDNIIVFSNGEKLNPATIEDTLTGLPKIRGAMVVGQGRFQPALILEPCQDPKDGQEMAHLIDEIWPTLQEVNKETVAHGRISKDFIGVSCAGMPFPRSAKGSLQRALALELYKDNIEELYERALSGEAGGPVILDLSSEASLAQSIVQLVGSRIGVSGLSPETDFFDAGIDSAQVIRIASLLRAGLKDVPMPAETDLQDSVTPKQIYANNSSQMLAGYISSLVSGESGSGQEQAREIKVMEELLAKYTMNLPAPQPGKPAPNDEGQTVVLTGTTGSLGAYMLDMLCASPRVKKVVAMNRGADGGRSRQAGVCSDRGLATDLSKVQFVGVDVSKPMLGMDQQEYTQLLSEVDRVIHNAWSVNFNLSVGSFEPQVRGVRHLVDMVAAAAKRAPIAFLSSVGSVGGWQHKELPVPEEKFVDLSLPVMGYGRSKAISGLILDAAAARSGLHTAVVRVGQVSGPRGEKGCWNKPEYFPSLVASGLHLGVLPDDLGPRQRVDWLTMEEVAATILEIVGATTQVKVDDISGYYSASNPNPASWPDMARAVKEFYGGRIQRLVSLEEWQEILERSAASADADLERNPSIKLLESHRDVLRGKKAGILPTVLATERTASVSPTVRASKAVTPAMMQHWCRQWDY
ncbi:L-aminoadipate-semialdehyde dehydrogenase [Ophiocordyceps camponoti-floridani]|uniref:L-aminoadipate-semialdehyde dehydrogenase n=1 Tax=Ophiocordyceps camponoti-floridani TaxID=2030778 RepID=A0A8H4QDL4_9HYPO|nr:L-aminoadipate-semialdehyde dehydrogenase [Ophiocordyceps camponoti-floridani]